jgi:non-reducing end beta-L-arabinofuranosidase
MLEIATKGEYADVLERQIFNGAIAGIALDGKHFYYVNPLEADPEASKHSPDRQHVLMHRAEWFGCACCPANIARFIASIDQYLYTVREDSRQIIAHQFIANTGQFFDGIQVEQKSNFPWDGHVEFSVTVPQGVADAEFLVRIPVWSASNYLLNVNGKKGSAAELGFEAADGFVTVPVATGTTVIELDLDMAVKYMRAKSSVRHDAGKLAVMRGPVVFCIEESDNAAPLWQYRLNSATASQVQAHFDAEKLEGVEVLTVPAQKRCEDPEEAPLYQAISGDSYSQWKPAQLTFIPYYAWANREIGQMQVWMDSDR